MSELTVEKIKTASRTVDYCPTLVNEINGEVVPSNVIIDFLLSQLGTIERETAEKCKVLAFEEMEDDSFTHDNACERVAIAIDAHFNLDQAIGGSDDFK